MVRRTKPAPPAARGHVQRLAMALAACALVAGGTPAVPPLVSYQGKLVDSGGVPVPDGPYPMEFRFYDACSGGDLLLTDVHAAVVTSSGIYSVLLGSGTLVPGLESDLGAVFASHDGVCLGVQVAGDAEMTPRQPIVSAPFAIRAAVADTAVDGITDDDEVTWTGEQHFDEAATFADDAVFEEQLALSDRSNLWWPHVTGNPPPGAKFRITKANDGAQPTHPNGEADEYLSICYNCPRAGSGQEIAGQQAYVLTLESNYWDGVTESVEYNWNYYGLSGAFLRPFINRVYVTGPEQDRGYFHFYAFSEPARAPHLEINTAGTVRFSRAMRGFVRRDESGSVYAGLAPSFAHDTEITPSSNGGDFFGFHGVSDFDSAAAGRSINGMTAGFFENRWTGSANDRSITSRMVGLDVRHTLSQTGDCPSGPDGRCVAGGFSRGISVRFTAPGENLRVPSHDQILVLRPEGVGADTEVRNFHGLRIEDQIPPSSGFGFGTIGHAALLIEAQSGADPEKGNLWLEGGNFDDGHLAFGASHGRHLWVDDAGTLRYKPDVPSTAGDGAAITGETECETLRDPAGGEDLLWFRVERSITVTGIDCLVAGAGTATVRVAECDASGGACGDTEAALSCGTSNTTESGAVDDPAIDAGDWVRLAVDGVSGSPSQVAVCVTFVRN